MSTKTKATKAETKTPKSKTKAAPAAGVQTAEVAPPKSIRQTLRQGILAGRSTQELTAVLQANFPNSMAAAKPAKHIAHYRSLLKREAKQAVKAVQAAA